MPFPQTASPLARALAERNYLQPTPVQTAVLEESAASRDLLVSAQTGSGKTVAYGLAIGPTLLAGSLVLPSAGAPLALVVAPTRELALQVQRELSWLFEHARGRVVACVGGMDPRREQRVLAGGTHIVVGTPGRLRDHLERGNLDPSQLLAVVLDEADEMLDLGFREDLEFILQTTPPERRTLLFSATLPKGIANLAQRYQRDGLRIAVQGGERGHADIEYRAVRVFPREVEHAAVNLLRQADAPSALVFCNTRETVRHFQAALLERGFSTVSLSGELSQNERNHAMQSLRDGRARVCVATDVAARGIDLPNLDLVIHADLPRDPETLLHRSGRTGRAGRRGISVLLVPSARRRRAEAMLAAAGVSATWSAPPTADEIRRLDGERLMRDPLFAEDATDEDRDMAKALLAVRTPEEVAGALARLYRARLPAPEDVTDPGPGESRRTPVGPAGPAWEREPRKGPGERRSKAGSPNEGRWFRLDVGRRNNADPRWLLPMLCRRGGVTKSDIGAIRIFDRETKVAIREDRAADFASAIGRVPNVNPAIEAVAADGSRRAGKKGPGRA